MQFLWRGDALVPHICARFIRRGDALVPHAAVRSPPRYRHLCFVIALPRLCNCAAESLLLCDWAFIAVFSGSYGICYSILSATICNSMLGTRRPLSQCMGCYEPDFNPQQPCHRFYLLAHWRCGLADSMAHWGLPETKWQTVHRWLSGGYTDAGRLGTFWGKLKKKYRRHYKMWEKQNISNTSLNMLLLTQGQYRLAKAYVKI